MPPRDSTAVTPYTATPASNVLGAVFSPPMVNSAVVFPWLERMVTVCLPAASVRRYTAFRYTSMLPSSAI